VYGNLLWEAVLQLLKHQPWMLLLLPFWYLSGRARFATRVAQRIQFMPEHLPYRQDVLALAREAKRLGRPVFLMTDVDVHESLARPIAEFLGCFDEVVAGSEIQTCANGTPYETVRELLPVLASHPNGSILSGLCRAIRPSQWAKNLLLAVPLIMSHQLGDWRLWGQLAVAFLAFSCCASAGYVINDLLDLEADRRHPSKRHRPFASGQVPIPLGLGAALVLGTGGVLLATVGAPASFLPLLILYLVLTFAYSLYGKRQLVMDALVLAGLYTHRVVAGGVAVEVMPSPWLLAFSMFLFLSLAFAKRYAELLRLKLEEDQEVRGRGYYVDDLPMVGNLGTASGYIAVLVFILYLNNSPDVRLLYSKPAVLWLISPILLYWISRVWLLVQRGILHEDPVLFTLSDRVSYICGILILLLILISAGGLTFIL
jgi:4-hydroxybenzoate polyprenyltransferase